MCPFKVYTVRLFLAVTTSLYINNGNYRTTCVVQVDQSVQVQCVSVCVCVCVCVCACVFVCPDNNFELNDL